jgi:hypothetical protein
MAGGVSVSVRCRDLLAMLISDSQLHRFLYLLKKQTLYDVITFRKENSRRGVTVR